MLKRLNNLNRNTWILFFAWMVLFAVLFLITGNHTRHTIKKIALSQARAYLDKDQAFRQWVSKHGGLYVPITRETPPNPYLAHIATRDIISSDGTPLTLMNPAYAIRAHYEMFTELYGVSGHITSQKLLRPENAPDDWELAALKQFNEGTKEVHEIIDIDGQPFLRFIQPIKIRPGCLKCHDHQNYKVGDIRGGVSISLPMASLHTREQHSSFIRTIILSGLWFLGSFFIMFVSNKLGRANRERDNVLQRMETLYQKSADGILLIQDGNFFDCNEAAVKMLGRTEKKNLIGCHPADFSPEFQPDGRSSLEKSEEMMRLCLEQGSIRFQWIHQNNEKQSWIEVVLTRIEWQHKPVIHVAWRDINELKKSQEQLAKYQNQLEDLLAERTADLQETEIFLNKSQEISHVGSWKLNLQTDELTWSDEVYRIFGVSPLELNPNFDSFMAAIHPDDRDMVQQAYSKAIHKHIPYDVIHRIVRPDRSIRYVHEKSEELVNDAGETVFSIGMIQDITDRKHAELSLQRSQRKFQLLVDDMGDKFVVFSHSGMDGELTYVSEGVTMVLGLAKEDAIGKSWATVVDWLPEDLELANINTRKLLKKQADFVQFEMRFTHPNGDERAVRISAHLLQEESNSSFSIGGIAEDITEQKQINLQLIEAQQRAEEANKQKSLFLANMSHEIRTPMNALIGLSELALETPLTDQQHDYLSKIYSSSQALLTIINDILDYSKIEAGKMTFEKRPFSLPKLIDQVENLFVDQAEQKGLQLVFDIDSSVPLFYLGDSSRLHQVLVNLVGNALKFTNQGTVQLTVSLMQQSKRCVQLKFSVIDSGIGIPADKLTQLFISFSQVDASHTRKYGGTGLGLAISSQLIKLMGGELTVHSSEGKGSEFSIILDLQKADKDEMILFGPQNKQEEKKNLAMKQINGAHILLVEDNAINRQVSVEILSKANLDVEIAVNGKEAVEEYRSGLNERTPFDAILMDIQMPILDGYEATARIREYERCQLGLSSHIPIIALTAHTMAGDQNKCLAAGMDDFISKPVNSGEMFVTLAKWIGYKMADQRLGSGIFSGRGACQEFSATTPLPDNLPGIELQEGVSRLEGNTELYLSLLKKFRKEQSRTAREIKENFQKNDLDKARTLLHTIKGLAANLGAPVLTQTALNLENALDKGKNTVVLLDLFMDSFDEFLVSITQLLPEKSDQAAASTVDSRQIAPMIKKLTSMLAANHFNATEKWLELKPLFQAIEPERTIEIDRYINRFEFDQAIQLLTETANKMEAVTSKEIFNRSPN